MSTVVAATLIAVRRDNPLCGDQIELSIGIDEGRVRPAGHRAHACSLVVASADALESIVAGMTPAEARALIERVQRALRGVDAMPSGCEALAPAILLPTRRRCALLPWLALGEALEGK